MKQFARSVALVALLATTSALASTLVLDSGNHELTITKSAAGVAPQWMLHVCATPGVCRSVRYDTLGSLNCTFGQVAAYSTTTFEWECTDPVGFGDDFDLRGDEGACAGSTDRMWSFAANDCVDDADTPASLAASCADGQVMRWSAVSSAWQCSNDNDLLADVQDDCDAAVDMGDLATVFRTGGAWSCVRVTDEDTLAELTGCSEGDLVQWDGSAWTCGADSDVFAAVAMCADGEVFKVSSSGGWECAADIDTWADAHDECVALNNAGIEANTLVANGDNEWLCQPSTDASQLPSVPGLVGGAFSLSATWYDPAVTPSSDTWGPITDLRYSDAQASANDVGGLRAVTRGNIVGVVLTARAENGMSFAGLTSGESATLTVTVQGTTMYTATVNDSNTAATSGSSTASWYAVNLRETGAEINFDVGAQIAFSLDGERAGRRLAVTASVLIAYEFY